MSKSNVLLPGRNDCSNGTTIQCTSGLVKPSCLATAYVTALSKPSPDLGSLTFQNVLCGVPPNHGGYAGLSVPTVSRPAPTRWSLSFVQLGPDVVVDVEGELDLLEPPQPAAPTARAKTSARSARSGSRNRTRRG